MAASHRHLAALDQAAYGRTQPGAEFRGQLHAGFPAEAVVVQQGGLMAAVPQIILLGGVVLHRFARPYLHLRQHGGVISHHAALADHHPFEERGSPADGGPVAQQRPGHGRGVPHIAALQQHRFPDPGVAPHPAAVVQHRKRADLGRLPDLYPFADIHRGNQHIIPLRPLPLQQQAVRRAGAVYLPLQDVPLAGHVGMQVSDIAPIGLGFIGIQGHTVPQKLGKEILGKVEGPSRGDVVQHLRGQNIYPRVGGVGDHLGPARFFQKTRHPPVRGVFHQSVFPGILHMGDHQGDGGAFLPVKLPGGGEIDGGQGVPADYQDFLSVVRRLSRGEADAAGGSQRLLLLHEA